ncbi:LPS translocon maturation chaperone LptM [Paludibacterium yongneupense]|uniref:LPS translocon maturation chaperone LptM n=1 Tax=Paludibacterium yongneupense TaxID=400061 RepID=UPI0004140172|nr:lipoprotein [Paludibacterium yongneupense]
MRKLIAILASVMLVTACGFKGPLYLPNSKPAHKHASSDTSAPASKKNASAPATQGGSTLP